MGRKVKMMLRELKRFINGEISTKWLIRNGMKVGNHFHRGSRCFIDPSHCFLISIGNNVTMSIGVTVLAHDASTEKLLGYTRIGQVNIKDNVFIGANSIILPRVTIGNNSIIGAGSVVTHDIPDNVVAAGNPARIIVSVEQYIKKNKEMMKKACLFPEEFTMRHYVTDDMKKEMIDSTIGKLCFIK